MEKRFKRIFIEEEQKEEEHQSCEEDKQETSKNRENRGTVQWNSEEKRMFLDLLKKHGRDWVAIAESLPNKTDK